MLLWFFFFSLPILSVRASVEAVTYVETKPAVNKCNSLVMFTAYDEARRGPVLFISKPGSRTFTRGLGSLVALLCRI